MQILTRNNKKNSAGLKLKFNSLLKSFDDFSNIIKKYQKIANRRKAIRELNGLSDKMLEDIGVQRSEIKNMFK